VMKSRTMGWVRHVACMGHEKCIQNFGQKTWREETTRKFSFSLFLPSFVLHKNLTIKVEVFCVVALCSVVVGWRWKQEARPKRWYPTTTLHSVITKNSIWSFIAEKTSIHAYD
jgi:hypothetical protein